MVGTLPLLFVASLGRIENGLLPVRIKEALEWADWKSVVRGDSVVFVKPNFPWTEVQTGRGHISRVSGCAPALLKERAGRVLWEESDLPIFATSKAFQGLGINKICRLTGAAMVEWLNCRGFPR